MDSKLDPTNSDPGFMNTIITGDESWVYGDDPETKSSRYFLYNENSTRALNTKLTNSMTYGTRRFNAAFTRAL